MKKLEIKKLPWYIKLSPFHGSVIAAASYPYIFVSEKLYGDLNSDNPSIKNLGIIEHEKYHLERQKELGSFYFKAKYFFSAKFRLQEELDADRRRFRFLKQNGEVVDLLDRSEKLSGSWYFWMISYEKALFLLKELWNES